MTYITGQHSDQAKSATDERDRARLAKMRVTNGRRFRTRPATMSPSIKRRLNLQMGVMLVFIGILVLDLILPQVSSHLPFLQARNVQLSAVGTEGEGDRSRSVERPQNEQQGDDCEKKPWWQRIFCSHHSTKGFMYNDDGDVLVLESMMKHSENVLNQSGAIWETWESGENVCEDDENEDGWVRLWIRVGDDADETSSREESEEGSNKGAEKSGTNNGMALISGEIIGGRFGSFEQKEMRIDSGTLVRKHKVNGRVILNFIDAKKSNSAGEDEEEGSGINLRSLEFFPFDMLVFRMKDDVRLRVGIEVKCHCIFEKGSDEASVCDRKGEAERTQAIIDSSVGEVKKLVKNSKKMDRDTAESLFQLVALSSAFERG